VGGGRSFSIFPAIFEFSGQDLQDLLDIDVTSYPVNPVDPVLVKSSSICGYLKLIPAPIPSSALLPLLLPSLWPGARPDLIPPGLVV
jgi:hypothetical protein